MSIGSFPCARLARTSQVNDLLLNHLDPRSFSKESTSSTSNRSRPSSVLSPTTPTTSRPRSVAESTSSQRASSLADMSLQGERVISTAGQDQLDSKTDIDQIEASLTDSSSGLLVDAQSGVDANGALR